MYKELREKAESKVQAKVTFYICAIVFAFVSIILLMIGSYIPSVAFWLKLPILAFVMILGIIYINAFGLPFTDTYSDDWREEEIEKEMVKLYREKRVLPAPGLDLSLEDELELKEIERLDQKWGGDEQYN